MNDAIRRAWRTPKEERTPEDKRALKEYHQMKSEDIIRPRLTAGSYHTAKSLADKMDIGVAAFLERLIQREAAGQVVSAKDHDAAIKLWQAKLLEAERDVDRVEARKEAEKEKAREAMTHAQQVVDGWLRSIELRMSALDFADVPEPPAEDFLGPSENDTTTRGGARAQG